MDGLMLIKMGRLMSEAKVAGDLIDKRLSELTPVLSAKVIEEYRKLLIADLGQKGD